MGRSFRGVWCIVILQLILAGCTRENQGDLVLFDFETDSELDRLEWNCHTLLSLSDIHVTHGLRSLRVELYPSYFPGVTPILARNDWRGYKELCFDIYNPQRGEVPITVRVDDEPRTPPFEERYNQRFVLQQGMNRIRIPLSTLITSGSGRRLNLCGICRLTISLPHPHERTVLYMDFIRLLVKG